MHRGPHEQVQERFDILEEEARVVEELIREYVIWLSTYHRPFGGARPAFSDHEILEAARGPVG